MPAPKKYPEEMKDRAIRLVQDLLADPDVASKSVDSVSGGPAVGPALVASSAWGLPAALVSCHQRRLPPSAAEGRPRDASLATPTQLVRPTEGGRQYPRRDPSVHLDA